MRLLAFRIEEHDSNFSYYDGKNVKYFSTERYFAEKHHGFRTRPDDQTVIDILKKTFNISIDDIDCIGVITDNYSFGKNLIV